MLLDLPRDIIRNVARLRFCAHTLRIETVTWTHNTSPACDFCNAHDVHCTFWQDEQLVEHVLFHCTHPHVISLRRTYASLFSSAGLNNVCFSGPGKQAILLPPCTDSFMSRLAVALLD